MELSAFINQYKPYDEAEAAEVAAWKQFLEAFGDNVWTRDNSVGHITESSWVVNKERTKVLMAYHNIYQNWAWLGGHVDGNKNLVEVAIKEAQEESGIAHAIPVCEEPVDFNVSLVVPHFKHGKYVAPHLHYNAVMLLEADETEEIRAKPDENKAVKWIKFEDVPAECKERAVIPYYLRIINKIKERGL